MYSTTLLQFAISTSPYHYKVLLIKSYLILVKESNKNIFMLLTLSNEKVSVNMYFEIQSWFIVY